MGKDGFPGKHENRPVTPAGIDRGVRTLVASPSPVPLPTVLGSFIITPQDEAPLTAPWKRRARSRQTGDPQQACVEVGWSNRRFMQNDMNLLTRINGADFSFKRAGSGALGVVCVAEGPMEGYCELHINAWDALAALEGQPGAVYHPGPAGCAGRHRRHREIRRPPSRAGQNSIPPSLLLQPNPR